MQQRRFALLIAAMLALAGCGAPNELEPAGPPGGRPVELAPNELPRVEAPVFVDPALETPGDPIWRESWLPIDNADRAGSRTTQMITRFVAPQPGLTIANIGAGGGFYDFLWSPIVGPTGLLYAVDIDRRMTRKISYERGARAVDNIRPLQVPRGQLGLAPGSVDVVTFLDTGAFDTCHAGHNPGYFRQAADALRSGGRLVIVNDYAFVGDPGPQHCRGLTPDELIALAAPRFTLTAREDVGTQGWHAFGLLFERRP